MFFCIGSNNAEATNAISKQDFKSKSFIALKEARESLYWIDLLNRNGYLDDKQYASIYLPSSILHLQQKGRYILLSAHREENRWSSERNGEPTHERMQSRTCSSYAEREGGRQSQSLLSDIAESRQRKAIANIDTEKNRRTSEWRAERLAA